MCSKLQDERSRGDDGYCLGVLSFMAAIDFYPFAAAVSPR
jgi:hypothetical protein